MDSTTSGAWQALPPLQTTWRGDRGSAAPILGRAAGSWARIRHWRATGKTVLFLPIPQRPDVILLLRYQRLTPAGKPDGTPRRMQCTTATGCSKTRCTRHGAAGECVVMDNNLGYRDGPVVVVVVGWPKADTSPTGPGKRGWTTEYASWGFVTGQLPPRQAHVVQPVPAENTVRVRQDGSGSGSRARTTGTRLFNTAAVRSSPTRSVAGPG